MVALIPGTSAARADLEAAVGPRAARLVDDGAALRASVLGPNSLKEASGRPKRDGIASTSEAPQETGRARFGDGLEAAAAAFPARVPKPGALRRGVGARALAPTAHGEHRG